MVFRESPRCPFCGKVTATAIYDPKPNFYGDSFVGWEYEKHEDCPGLKKIVRDQKISKILKDKNNEE